jgi:ribonuclease P protein component
VFVEEDVSAAQPPPAENPRIPGPDEVGRRAEGTKPPPGQGSAPPDRIVPPAHEGRLRSRRDFQNLYSEGTAVRGRLMVLIFRRNDQDRSRCAFVASGKVGGAVVRNRAKRLLREAFRGLRRDANISGHDVILIARPDCARTGIRAVSEELVTLYKQARLWRGGHPTVNGQGTT